MNFQHFILWLLTAASLLFAGINAYPSQTPQSSSSTPPYVPHEVYPFNDGYGPPEPHKTQLQPVYHPPEENNADVDSLSSLLSRAEAAIHVGNALRSLATLGTYIVTGVALLLLSGLLTIAVCSTTTLCTIKFSRFDQDAARYLSSSLTPEKLTRAAVLVEDAIGKYQRLQRSVNN